MIDAARLWALQTQLLQRARQTPPRDWLPVVIGAAEVGIASPEVASFLASQTPHFELVDYRLALLDEGLDKARRSALLNDCALRLRDAGILRG